MFIAVNKPQSTVEELQVTSAGLSMNEAVYV